MDSTRRGLLRGLGLAAASGAAGVIGAKLPHHEDEIEQDGAVITIGAANSNRRPVMISNLSIIDDSRKGGGITVTGNANGRGFIKKT
jgi:hypothetical protein